MSEIAEGKRICSRENLVAAEEAKKETGVCVERRVGRG